MSIYQPVISKSADAYYALVVRVDEDGQKNVIAHYKGRHFKTSKAALKSTSAYIAKYCS